MSKCQNDNSWLIWVALMPIWVVLILSTTSNDSEYDLLTDEQKIEKQKEIELQKQQKELEHQQNVQWWKDNINYVVDERPALVIFMGGIVIFAMLIRTGQSRSDWYFFEHNRFLGWLNIKSLFVIIIGLMFLAWATGVYDPLNLEINLGELTN